MMRLRNYLKVGIIQKLFFVNSKSITRERGRMSDSDKRIIVNAIEKDIENNLILLLKGYSYISEHGKEYRLLESETTNDLDKSVRYIETCEDGGIPNIWQYGFGWYGEGWYVFKDYPPYHPSLLGALQEDDIEEVVPIRNGYKCDKCNVSHLDSQPHRDEWIAIHSVCGDIVRVNYIKP
jgi:hypothetical protein